jgi:sigma-B regulation protein RsbU (phosphoserine phosphatase)
MIFSNAGHCPLLLLKKKNLEFEKVDTEGLPVGIERASKYVQRSLKLEPDDIVLLYTDGIVEARNPDGDEYSLERLQAVLKESSGEAAGEIVKHIKADVDRFESGAKQHDDRTVVIMKAG